jgi:hypothetical protein
MTLPLEFYAEDNVSNEVINPIVTLGKMALPRARGNAFYAPPGPRIFGDLGERHVGLKNEGDHIIVRIPSFLTFSNIIIVSVDPEFVTRDMHETGPMRATCSVTFRTLYAFTEQELEATFDGWTGITE